MRGKNKGIPVPSPLPARGTRDQGNPLRPSFFLKKRTDGLRVATARFLGRLGEMLWVHGLD